MGESQDFVFVTGRPDDMQTQYTKHANAFLNLCRQLEMQWS